MSFDSGGELARHREQHAQKGEEEASVKEGHGKHGIAGQTQSFFSSHSI